MKGFNCTSVFVVCLLLAPALARAEAPRLQSSRGTGGSSSKAATATGCADVSWLVPGKPPRFLTDVDQAKGSGDCQFHEFAAQNFFALALGASPAIKTWLPATQVFPAAGATVCGAAAALGSGVRPFLKKSPPTAVGDIPQASGQPLVDQNGRYVQYEIRVNPQLCQVVSRCQLYNKNCITAAAAVTPVFRFPAGDAQTPGVAEVKLAWRVMETCDLPDSPSAGCKKDSLADFLILKGITVEQYSPKQPEAVTVTLGLVGFHLIQKTATHHEYVWSTWEHVSNAPVCAGSDNSVCMDPSAASAASIGTASGWSLASPPASTDSRCDPVNIQDPVDGVPANCANTSYYPGKDTANQPRTQACRFLPCGGGNQSEIASLNKAIREKLAGNLWSRYFLVGTLWGKTPPSPEPLTGNPQEDPAGSVLLANTTMETYVQQTKNCFFCHRNGPAGTNIDFTHSLVRSTQSADACPVDLNTCANPPVIQPIRSSRP
jgi:hypothetical protein